MKKTKAHLEKTQYSAFGTWYSVFLFTFLFLAFGVDKAYGQAKFTISGTIKDADNGETLVGVNIFERDKKIGVVTNVYGFYSLSLPAGENTIVFQYIGYEIQTIKIDLKSNQKINISLKPESTLMDEVVVSTERADKNVTSVEMSTAKLDVKEIQRVPQLLGETDIIRTFTLLPGVSTVGEGANGFNVRGGNVDQNLILLDESPVYNSSHLFGFFSIFNADATKDVKLYKGGIPAEYGGRLSSVMDIRQREGNNQRFAMNGGLGSISSRLTAEGPIIKDKMSYLVSGRRSYADVFLAASSDPNINNNILYFYDFNGKVNYQINNRHRVFLSGYYGKDVLGIRNLVNFNWGNGTATARWNWIISDKLFSNTTAIFSDYQYSLGTPDDEEFNFKLVSRIRNYNFGQKFNWYVNNDLNVDFGFNTIYYQFDPGEVTGSFPISFPNEYALEPAVFISAEKKMGTRLTMQGGLRYSWFNNYGPYTHAIYANEEFPQLNEITGFQEYASGELIRSFGGLDGFEPRFSVNYLINEEQSIKLSYNRMRQYIHLISNTTSPLPIDLWRPSGKFIEPATANQVAGGYFRNFANNKWESSIELFYKALDNVIDYRDGADLFSERIETQLLTGIGRAYGLEFLLRKNSGKVTGWLSYTLSRSERRVDSDRPGATINQGNWYLANFDKPHDISLVINYQLSKKWDFGATFNYQTGRPFTLPYGRFETEGLIAPINFERNNSRIPDYHRLDLAATYYPSKNNSRKWQTNWNFGVYNAYARRNAFSIFYQQNEINPEVTEAVRLALFATIIPYVTYNFKF